MEFFNRMIWTNEFSFIINNTQICNMNNVQYNVTHLFIRLFINNGTLNIYPNPLALYADELYVCIFHQNQQFKDHSKIVYIWYNCPVILAQLTVENGFASSVSMVCRFSVFCSLLLLSVCVCLCVLRWISVVYIYIFCLCKIIGRISKSPTIIPTV